jgi:translation initiation factor 2 alpha subunit (eIF-2alpha)
MTKTEKYKKLLQEKQERLVLYKDMEVKMLTGSAQSYSLGSRSKTNYNMSLSEIRTAIQKLEEEIEELEGLISGTKSRKCVAIIPRF